MGTEKKPNPIAGLLAHPMTGRSGKLTGVVVAVYLLWQGLQDVKDRLGRLETRVDQIGTRFGVTAERE